MRRSLLLALALLLPAPAYALVFVSGDGQGNSSAPPDDPGWNHVGRVGGLNGTYLGNGWVLTANHVPTGDTVFAGVAYPAVPGSDVQLANPDQSLADLKVFRIDPSPSLPLLRIRATTPPVPPTITDVTMIAGGALRGAATSWSGYDGFFWGTTTGMHWGTNRIAGAGLAAGNWTLWTDFTKVSMGGTTHEAQGATGDSGGALFIKNGANWELAGVLFAVGPFGGQPDQTALHGKPSQPIGNLTYVLNLAVYRAQLISLTRPECANEVDDDGDSLIDWPADPGCTSQLDTTELPDQDLDGVGDSEDNCLVVANGAQQDSNLDGYGNLCDADFDGDGAAGVVDFGAFKAAYSTTSGAPGYDPDVDLDSDGGIGIFDYGLFRFMYDQPVGPSGLACAGTPPCP